MPRFFVSPAAMAEDRIVIEGEACRHIALSLRMAVGDPVTLSDGQGQECDCRLSAITPTRVEAEVLCRRMGEGELPVYVSLYQGNPKGDKLELIVQKAVELGASAIIPFESSRCVARVKAERVDKQTARLSRIAEEAAGQCGRAALPTVDRPCTFAEALSKASATHDAVLFCYENENGKTLRGALEEARVAGAKRLALFVGSEGGFSPEEAAAAAAAGAVSVSLGKRILRCETAPLYALSCVGFLYEE